MASPKYQKIPNHEQDNPAMNTMDTEGAFIPSQVSPPLPLPASHSASSSTAPITSPPPSYVPEAMHLGDSQDEEQHTAYPLPSAGQYLPLPASSLSPSPPPASNYKDGVFSNLSAKPSAIIPPTPTLPVSDSKESPPSYDSVAMDPAPIYPDNIVFTATLDSDDMVLVEGLPVGSMLTFFLTMMVSMSFQFVGFCLTYFLSMTHAGRCGSKAGFGVTLIQIGLNLHGHFLRFNDGTSPDSSDDEFPGYFPPNATPDEIDAILTRTQWISYLLMVVGWLVILKSSLDYLKAKRLEALILATPESMIA